MRNISDHDAVIGTLDFTIDEVLASERRVYDFKKDSWMEMRQYFHDMDWAAKFANQDSDSCTRLLLQAISDGVDKLIPSRTITTTISTHPWIDARCRQAADARLEAIGTANELFVRDECSRILLHEHDKYASKMRKNLGGGSPMPSLGSSRSRQRYNR